VSVASDELAKKVWEAISVAPFLDRDGKTKNEKWLYRVLAEFEDKVRTEVSSSQGNS
jgi:hypothetical protein